MAPSDGVSTCLSFLIIFCSSVTAWDSDHMELFDLVEEIGDNFYKILGVDESATSQEIRRAYRKLSLQLHPDKNKAPDAEKKFLEMVSVYEVLKDSEKRQRYNDILQNGLPDWKQPVFYYRRVRKLGLLELSAIMFFILTFGQYLVVWSMYFEKKFTVEDDFHSRLKKSEKKSRKKAAICENVIEAEFEEKLNALSRPQLKDLWPLRLTCWLYLTALNTPHYYSLLREYVIDTWNERYNKPPEPEEDTEDLAQEPVKKVKKRQKIELPEYSPETLANVTAVDYMPTIDTSQDEKADQKLKSGTEWSEEEYALLAKAVAKFPGGTFGRWEKISEMVGRPVSEVLSKSKVNKKSFPVNVTPSLQGSHAENIKFKSNSRTTQISDSIISTKMDSNGTADTDVSEKEAAQTNCKKKTQNRIKSVPQNQTVSVSSSETSRTDSQSESPAENIGPLSAESKTDSSKGDAASWSQTEQMVLEMMLRQYPKGTEQRWERIAENLENKTKEDCIARYKHLVELVKKKKEAVPT